ncbi:MAG: 4-(cytidine 5'-diphospho)-2-C-methyl-D-erythritol kinase [Flavobacteriales bacterium]
MLVFPNAKINIGLCVVEKRADGFHNIESIFYPVFDLFDVLEVVESKELSFTSSGIEIPGSSTSNLCVQAFQLVKSDFDIPFVTIHLHKVIPIGAGLGGGSADAAFMLKALNELFKLNLTVDQLINYARELGSDCAFFIENKPVYAFNKGDEFENIELDLTPYQLKIEYPNIHIGTKEAYSGIVPLSSKQCLKDIISKPIEEWKSFIENDFEKSVFPSHPSIENVKKKMYADGAVFASMTGSGSAVFGLFENK